VLQETFDAIERAREAAEARLAAEEIGTVDSVGKGVARIRGLPGVRSEELLEFAGGARGIAFNLEREIVAAVLLDESERVHSGAQVRRSGRILDVPVGEELLGRIVDPLGRPLDGGGSIGETARLPIERAAPAIMERSPVEEPLQTGLQVVDALIPIGRGQRELILGDRQTGKTAVAVDTMINQRGTDVLCVYCGIAQRASAVAGVVADLRKHDVMGRTIVVVTTGDDTPGLKYVAPYAATSMAEHFVRQGRDVLIVYDDLTRHARAYRELSLLLRRPPAREAYPGDIFYVHSRLLERSTHLHDERGGGSLTALPIVETEAENISAYIPTNLISITDGQIYLSPKLFQEGILPPVDVGRSVSRVGGKTQLPAYRAVAGDLRLSYSQFEELESFARFGTELDEETRARLRRGRRVRQVLRQPQYSPIPAAEQVAVLLCVTSGVFDHIEADEVQEAKEAVRTAVRAQLPDLLDHINDGRELDDDDREKVLEAARDALDLEGTNGE
jgi:F-type H+-transporting ATPase subunit alpha